MSATQDLFLSACTGESSVERELRRDLAGTSRALTQAQLELKQARARIVELDLACRAALMDLIDDATYAQHQTTIKTLQAALS